MLESWISEIESRIQGLLYWNIVIFAKDFSCEFGLHRVHRSVSGVVPSWGRVSDFHWGYLWGSRWRSPSHSRADASTDRAPARTLRSGPRATADHQWILMISLCSSPGSPRTDGRYLPRYLGYFVLIFSYLYSRYSYLRGRMSTCSWVGFSALRYSASQKEKPTREHSRIL